MRKHEAVRRSVRALWILFGVLDASSALSDERSRPLDVALQYFTRVEPQSFRNELQRGRPAMLSPAQRAAVLASLPADGEVRALGAAQRRKLAGVEPVLRLHEREGSYAVKVVSVAQAGVGIHARSVVLISERALDLLDAQEVPAVVAHEIGHEYFWQEYEDAARRGDRARLQELELRCDGVAVVTLRQLGIPPERLLSGIERLMGYNAETLGRAQNETSYPSLSDRKKLVRALVRWLDDTASR